MKISFPVSLFVQSFSGIKEALQMGLNKQQQKVAAVV